MRKLLILAASILLSNCGTVPEYNPDLYFWSDSEHIWRRCAVVSATNGDLCVRFDYITEEDAHSKILTGFESFDRVKEIQKQCALWKPGDPK